MIYADDGNFYKRVLNSEDDFMLVQDLSFDKTPSAVTYRYNGKDVIIFSLENLSKVYDGDSVFYIDDAPAITSTCIHNERLFATEGGQKTTLWFSDDFNPLNWSVSLEDAGYIDLRDDRGSLLKVVSFDGYLYVFRNYGITRITAYGDQTAFSVDGITASASRIIPESICVCGDRIVYLAEDGFYSFSGGTPVRIMEKLDGLNFSDKSTAKAKYYRGNYYCVVTLKNQDDKPFQAIVCYSLKDSGFTIGNNLNIIDFAVMEGEKEHKLLFICADNRAIGGTPANAPELVDEYLRRVESMYHRAQNHVSIIAFSLGKKAGNGYNLYKAYELLKSKGDSRAIIYEDADGEWNTDVIE
jgi:hypothetical protein